MRAVGKFGLYGVLLFSGAAWGLTIPLNKVMVATDHHPIGLLFWLFTFGAAILAVVLLAQGRRPRILRAHLGYLTVVAAIGSLIPGVFTFIAAKALPAGVMGINIATVPMFALLIAAALRVEQVSLRRALGVGLGGFAIVLLIGPETSLPDPSMAPYVLLALIPPLCYGAEGSYIALKAPADIDPLETLFGAFVIGAIAAAPLLLMLGEWVDLSARWSVHEIAILANAALHVVGYSGYLWLVGRAGPVFAAQIAYLVTIYGILFSMAFLGESYSAWVWLAVVSMIAGLSLVQPRREDATAAS